MKREQRDLTRFVTCDCGCEQEFHPFKTKIFKGKKLHHFLDNTHYAKYRRGKHSLGRLKLTAKKVREIFESKGKYTGAFLAFKYKVSKVTIYKIWDGSKWNHITHKRDLPIDT